MKAIDSLFGSGAGGGENVGGGAAGAGGGDPVDGLLHGIGLDGFKSLLGGGGSGGDPLSSFLGGGGDPFR